MRDVLTEILPAYTLEKKFQDHVAETQVNHQSLVDQVDQLAKKVSPALRLELREARVFARNYLNRRPSVQHAWVV